ncbi:MAG: hypothetical protein U0031_18625 [Thermomicrobiales bacterium]
MSDGLHGADRGGVPRAVRVPRWMEDALCWIAVACAIVLLLAIVMPNWFARTLWSMGRKGGTSIIDSPAGYVGMVSLCGLVALAALVFCIWRPRESIVVAMGAFAVATVVIADYWLALGRGVVGLEGDRDAVPVPGEVIHWPTALPLFAACAVVGTTASLALAVVWLRRARIRTAAVLRSS